MRGNVAASVRQRLLNLAREGGETYDVVLSRYVRERFLYRLGQSSYRDRFIVKGATLFLVWMGEPHRITRDLDLLGYGASSETALLDAMRAICAVKVEHDDGLVFEHDQATAAPIREGQSYEGVRVRVVARLGSARIPLQIDIGLGDAVTPTAESAQIPPLLDSEPPVVRVYPRETVIAEKYQALVVLGMANSRMKDYYDLWYLGAHFDFDAATLREAIVATFERRGTARPSTRPLGLSAAFSGDAGKVQQWRAFLRKGRLDAPPLVEVVEWVERLLWQMPDRGQWKARRGWETT
ncbi:MAG: nucleotidyl transferase AbiEii/AbiGii toxin family protein [Rhodothermales bacterium]